MAITSPIVGGILPSGQIAAELSNITRRGGPEMVVDQFRSYSPLLSSLIDNAQIVSGGFDPITVPVQGLPMTTAATIGYDGSFAQPAETQGIFNAQFTLSGLCVPIGFYGAEAAIQMDHSIVNRLTAKLNDASNSLSVFAANALYSTTINTNSIVGLPAAIDDGTNSATYGGIVHATNPWFNSYVVNRTGTPAPTRALVMTDMIGTAKKAGNEMPTFAVTGPGTWMSLASDILSQESYQITPGNSFANVNQGASAGFRAIEVAGTPVFFDLYAPEGAFYYINSNYLNLYLHQSAMFDISDFYSMMGNFVLGYVALCLAYTQLVNCKPSSCGYVSGYSSISL